MAWLEIVKNSVTTEEVLDRFLGQSKSYYCNRGKYVCPFHGDKNPSISINQRTGKFKCFGCGVSGDGLDFVQMYFKVNQYDALKILNEEFHLGFENYTKDSEDKINKIRLEKERKRQKEEQKQKVIRSITNKLHIALRVLEDIYNKYYLKPNEDFEKFKEDEIRVSRSMWAIYQEDYLRWLLDAIDDSYCNCDTEYPSYLFDYGVVKMNPLLFMVSDNKTPFQQRAKTLMNLFRENSVGFFADKYY